jgi:hypothetical protein
MRHVGQRRVEHLDIDLEPLLARPVEERLEQLTDPGIGSAQPFRGSERA